MERDERGGGSGRKIGKEEERENFTFPLQNHMETYSLNRLSMSMPICAGLLWCYSRTHSWCIYRASESFLL